MFVLSAGHNPKDKGAIKFDDPQFNEYDEACKWVDRLAEELMLVGVSSHTVPTGTLRSKIAYINSLNFPIILAMEIHFNSSPNIKAVGSETLYCPGSLKGLEYATIVQAALASVFKPDRGVKEGWYRMDKPGHVDYKGDVDGDEKKDAFLSQVRPVSLIIEPEFIHNRGILATRRDTACKILAQALYNLSTTQI